MLLTAARSLSSRYHPQVGAIRSWNGGGFQVIVDSLMNLELLFRAAELGGTTSRGGSPAELRQIALNHARKTLQNHVRADGGTYHLVNYSSATGRPLSKRNAGGLSTETTWSRGQGWAIYGFSMIYRESGEPEFLEAARRTADYFLDHLPVDSVPAADFSSTYRELERKDSSAAAVAAAGLVELSSQESDPVRKERYWQGATRILASLSAAPYLSTKANHPGLLLHGARSYPGDNLSLIYGDYYLLEAALRYAREQASRQGA